MWMLDVVWLVLIPLASGGGAVYLLSWGLRRALRNMQHDLAVVEDRLLREVKRRASETRWSEADKAPVPDVEEAVKEIRRLAVGQVDDQGWLHGKEGGVKRGLL